MTRGLSIEFQAILDGDVYQPGSGGIDEATGETMEAQQEGVGTARPMPDTEMEVGDQPEEEAADSSDPNHDLRTAAKERAVNSLENLADGTIAYLRFAYAEIQGTLWPNASMIRTRRQQLSMGLKLCARPSYAIQGIKGHVALQRRRLLLNHQKTGRQL